MKNLIFEIDTYPLSLDPLKCNDYVGRQILGAVYEKLTINYNCIILKQNNIYTLTLLFENISVDAYIETFNYHKDLKNNSIYFRFFKDVEFKKKSEKTIVFFIKESYLYDFEEILQSLFFIPLNLNSFLNNGPYKFEKITRHKIILVPNSSYWNKNNIEKFRIIFILNKDSNKTYKLYKTNKIMISSNTHFNCKLFKKNDIKKDINIVESNLLFFFEVKNNDLKKYIVNNLEIFKKNLELSKLLKFFKLKNKLKFDYFENKTLKIIYSDFYPNTIIINELKTILNSLNNVKLYIDKVNNFETYITMDKTNYDIILHLITPSIKDETSLINEKISLNKNDFFNLLIEKTKYIPIAKGKSIFLKKKEINLIMDELGQIRFDLIKWRKTDYELAKEY